MSLAPKSVFFKDYSIKPLELKGDYELWAEDVKEYFAVSGLPQTFAAIVNEANIEDRIDWPEEADAPPRRQYSAHP